MFQFMTSQTYSWGRLHGISRNGNVMGTLYANLLEDHGITIRLSLVGGIPTPLKHEFVSWDDDIPNIWKIPHVPNHQTHHIFTFQQYKKPWKPTMISPCSRSEMMYFEGGVTWISAP